MLAVNCKGYVERSGGTVIFLFQFSRLVIVLVLLGLSMHNFLGEKQHIHRYDNGSFSERRWIDLAFCLNYVCSPHST
jgi:hypothetical protein